MDADELDEAWEAWYSRYYEDKDVDRLVEPFLQISSNGPSLRAAREALFLSMRTVARRLGVHFSSYQAHEKAEAEGRITLESLRRCAEAMDCELVYAIRPKNKRSFSWTIWLALIVECGARVERLDCGRVGLQLASLMRDKMFDPRFRRAQGWARNNSSLAAHVIWTLRSSRVGDYYSNSVQSVPLERQS